MLHYILRLLWKHRNFNKKSMMHSLLQIISEIFPKIENVSNNAVEHEPVDSSGTNYDRSRILAVSRVFRCAARYLECNFTLVGKRRTLEKCRLEENERERERERERRTEKRAVEIECFHESNLSTEGKRVLAVVFKSCGEEQVRKRSYIEVRNKSLTVLDGLLTDIVRLVTLRLLPVERAFSNWIVNSSRFKELCSTLTWFERYWISIWSTFHFRPMQCIGATTCRESGVWLTNNSDNIVRKFARFWKCIDSSHSGYSDDVYYAVFIAWWFIEF